MSLSATALGVKAAPAVVAAAPNPYKLGFEIVERNPNAPKLVGIWAFREAEGKVGFHGITAEHLVQSQLRQKHRGGAVNDRVSKDHMIPFRVLKPR